MRELQQILERAGFISGGGLPINSFNFFAQWGERATAYVQPARGRVAVPGWENADVAFGKDVPRSMISEAEELVRKYYKFRYFSSVTVGGRRYWIMTLRRASAVYGFATGGSAPTPPQPTSDEWLWFQLPNGGTVTLNRIGSPTTVTLEVSLDNGATWSEWAEVGNARTQTLAAGQTMHVRNASAVSTNFGQDFSNYYQFSLSEITYSGGNIDSLFCKNADDAIMNSLCFYRLFLNQSNLLSIPLFSGKTSIYGFREMFRNCNGLTETTLLKATTLSAGAYLGMFQSCSNLSKVRTLMTDISELNSLNYWLLGVSNTGDFYCPADLTIPTGASGIPTGWTRHDL